MFLYNQCYKTYPISILKFRENRFATEVLNNLKALYGQKGVATQITAVFVFYKAVHRCEGRAEAPSAPSLECLRTFNGASFSTPHADIIYAYVGATGAKNKHEDAKNG